MTVLVTTHYLDEAEYCHRIAVIHAGRIAALGTTTELKRAFADRPILELQASHQIDVMRALEGMDDVETSSVFGTAVHAVLRPGATTTDTLVVRLRAQGLDVTSATVVAPSLEDVFLDVVEQAVQP